MLGRVDVQIQTNDVDLFLFSMENNQNKENMKRGLKTT